MPRIQNIPAAAAMFVVSIATSACDTDDQLKQQRATEIQNEYVSLVALQDTLSKGEVPRKDGIEVFISKGVLDQSLAAMAGVEFPVPNVDGATIRIEQIKTDFRIGFPRVEVRAIARKAGAQLTLSLAARLETEIVNGDPSTLRARVHVDSVVPVISWSMFEWKVGGFVRDIAQAKFSDLVNGPDAIGKLDVPLGKDFRLALAPKSTPVPLGVADANIGTPAIGFILKTSIDRIIFLPDGIHLFGLAKV